MKTFKKVVLELIKRGETIATMESCTGGGVASAITNIEGASEILKYSAVTYSNQYKIKMGVSADVINEYSVYSMETAHEMALNISKFANSDFGVGITGKLNRADENNNFGKDNEVFVSIYYKDKYYDIDINVDKKTRKQNKELVIDYIIEKLGEILWGEKSTK
ncbi:MAG TPA: damage-inducible protein CinA [Firmicutes bacterium]|nr:damage-inducible protein CinA [Bacillota bacterium]